MKPGAARGSHAAIVLAFRAIGTRSGQLRDLVFDMKDAGLAGDWTTYAALAERMRELAGDGRKVSVPDRDLRRHWLALLGAAGDMAAARAVVALVVSSDQFVAANAAMQARCDEIVARLLPDAPGGP